MGFQFSHFASSGKSAGGSGFVVLNYCGVAWRGAEE